MTENGLAVFNAQEIVGGAQKPIPQLEMLLGRGLDQGQKRPISRLRPAGALAYIFFHQGGELGTLIRQQRSCLQNRLDCSLLAAKAERIHCAQAGEKRHAAGGEILRASCGKEGGKLHHQVRSAGQGHAGAQVFVINSGAAPLHKAAADGGHAVPGSGARLCLLDVKAVSAVEGVVFSYDAYSIHVAPPLRRCLRALRLPQLK